MLCHYKEQLLLILSEKDVVLNLNPVDSSTNGEKIAQHTRPKCCNLVKIESRSHVNLYVTENFRWFKRFVIEETKVYGFVVKEEIG